MGRQIDKLTARKAETVKTPGRHSDGGGLYLNVTESGAKSWLFMFKKTGRRREIGLGSARDVPLARARVLASEARQHVAGGRDPLAMRIKPASMTFGEAATALVDSMSSSWRNAKHRAQWTMTLTVYAAPLTPLPTVQVTTDDVLSVLQPLWLTKPETASPACAAELNAPWTSPRPEGCGLARILPGGADILMRSSPSVQS
jgi:Arm DNA-binding domain